MSISALPLASPGAGLWRLSGGDGLVHLQILFSPSAAVSPETPAGDPSQGGGTCLETTSATPLVTCRVKPTTESRARSERS